MDDSVPTSTGCCNILIFFMIWYLNYFKIACPLGQYLDAVNNSCKPCLSPCATCKTTASTCTSCIPGMFKNTMISGTITNIECVSACPADRFGDSNTGECVKCDPNDKCQTCTNATECLSCITGAFLYNKKCFTACPVGTYSDVNMCGACDTRCTSCTSFLSCTACLAPTFVLVGTTCQCSGGLVYDLSSKTCVTGCPTG